MDMAPLQADHYNVYIVHDSYLFGKTGFKKSLNYDKIKGGLF